MPYEAYKSVPPTHTPYYCRRKKEYQGKAYRRFREFMKLDELDDRINQIENWITYPCRSDGLWKKKKTSSKVQDEANIVGTMYPNSSSSS